MIDVDENAPASPLRGELEQKRRMEMLQDSYLRAVAAAAGCTMAKPDPDDGIDWQLCHSSESHTTDCQIDLKIQLKSTWTSAPNPANGFVSVTVANDRLRMLARTRVTVHRILVAMIVPENVADWIDASHDIFQLRHCAYWRSVTGVEPSGREKTAVRVSTSQIFDDVALCGIMERIGKGGTP
ncbi:DUF4365 domain-containing protein [Actinacidiphila oryziradicis]|uniref:DUF4365 domain-containing protein n=1 Tax=Actinacidiphila oryziradicis TaxID=2571141 RepID=A0A4U0RV65_9ACTN|nr:DUF4365 domain-containing protein [Actinacidiphila oryziradicis]TKA00106.1 DUF4365 domain-containing protein [Actinacidiphila oryziradicis]